MWLVGSDGRKMKKLRDFRGFLTPFLSPLGQREKQPSPFLCCYHKIPEIRNIVKKRGSVSSQFCRPKKTVHHSPRFLDIYFHYLSIPAFAVLFSLLFLEVVGMELRAAGMLSIAAEPHPSPPRRLGP